MLTNRDGAGRRYSLHPCCEIGRVPDGVILGVTAGTQCPHDYFASIDPNASL